MGTALGRSQDEGHRNLSGLVFQRGLPPVARFSSPRAWAFALLTGAPATLLGAATLTAQMAWKAKREEAFLRQELGPADYDAYAARTPMLIPFLRLSR